MGKLRDEGGAEEILCQPPAAFGVVWGDGFFSAVVDVEAAVFPGKEVGGLSLADEFGGQEGLEEVVAEVFGHGAEGVGGHGVEVAFGVEESVGCQYVDVGVEEEVVAKGVDGGCGGDAAVGKVESGVEGVAKGVDGALERSSTS